MAMGKDGAAIRSEFTATGALLVTIVGWQVRSCVEQLRRCLVESCIADGMPADEASRAAARIVHAALKLEAERFAPSSGPVEETVRILR